MKHKVKQVENMGLEGLKTVYRVTTPSGFYIGCKTRNQARIQKRLMEANGSDDVVIIRAQEFTEYVR